MAIACYLFFNQKLIQIGRFHTIREVYAKHYGPLHMLFPRVREEDLYTWFALGCFELSREKVREAGGAAKRSLSCPFARPHEGGSLAP